MIIRSMKALYLRALTGRAKMFQFTGQYENAVTDFRMVKKNSDDPRCQFEYFIGVSAVSERRGRFRPAIGLIEKAIRLSRRYPRSINASELRNARVRFLIQKRDNDGVIKLATSILRKPAISSREKASLNVAIGNAFLSMEKYDGALRYFLKARQISQRVNSLEGISTSDNNLTLVYWKLGKYREALKHGREALAVREKIGHIFGISSSMNNLGLINDEMGNYQEALRYYEKALDGYYRLNNIYGLTIALTNIGSIYHEILGNEKRAYEYYEKSYSYSRKTGDPISEADGLLALTEMHWRMEKRRQFVKAVVLLERLMAGIQSMELSVMFIIAQIKLRIWQKDRSGVNSKVDEMLVLLKRAKNDLLTMESVAALIDIIFLFALPGFLDKVASAVRVMEKNLGVIESPLKRTKILRALVKYHLLAGNQDQAGSYLRNWEDISSRYGIKADSDEIERLRLKVNT